jgi:hypothetical protein
MFTRGFMLDTSAINRVHDWRECPWSLRGPLYVTDIQLQEISRTLGEGLNAEDCRRIDVEAGWKSHKMKWQGFTEVSVTSAADRLAISVRTRKVL